MTPLPLIGLVHLPRYIRTWRAYARKAGPGTIRLRDSHPCLTDWTASTPFDPHYFYQGAWLARKLKESKPLYHVDVGSSVLMTSVLSGSVDTIFLDYRSLQVRLSGLTSVAGDIVRLPFRSSSIDSLSCLHVIEHIGLGRYGDRLDPQGTAKAAEELARVLKPGGRLYVSLPVGRQRVCFNAHRVHSSETVPELFPSLRLIEFSCVDDAGAFHEQQTFGVVHQADYACGMYVFERPET
jgi:SAM-dependent methyltransferase